MFEKNSLKILILVSTPTCVLVNMGFSLQDAA